MTPLEYFYFSVTFYIKKKLHALTENKDSMFFIFYSLFLNVVAAIIYITIAMVILYIITNPNFLGFGTLKDSPQVPFTTFKIG